MVAVLRSSLVSGWLLLLLGAVWTGFVSGAGRNEGGSLIVHADDSVSYTSGVCALFADHAPASCSQANTRTDKDSATPALVWLLAAFHPSMSPAVSMVVFGLEHNLPPGEGRFAHAGPCGPGSFAIPDLGWPDSGGNLVCFDPAAEDTLFAFYFLDVYGDAGSFLGPGIHPSYGRAYFLDASSPALDDIEQFGVVRWGAEGANLCPRPLSTGACCSVDMSCSVGLERECLSLGGVYGGDGTTCDQPCGACCYWDEEYGQYVRRCVITSWTDCLNEARWDSIKVWTGEFGLLGAAFGGWGHPCPGDPYDLMLCESATPVLLPRSWGQLKISFR